MLFRSLIPDSGIEECHGVAAAARWSAGGDAVAFFDPGVWDEWRRQGLPGRVIAFDNYTVAVSRL